MSATVETAAEIRPFTIDVPEEQLDDLRSRISATKWPDREVDASQGVQLATIQALAHYWATDYDWRKFEERLAALPHFITEIDGVDIHFIHVRSKHEDALPMIVTHGWPGSIIEQLKIIDPLTDPTAHGGERGGRVRRRDPVAAGPRLLRQADRARLGPDPHRQGLGVLMERLGYDRYVAQGGDWGNAVTEQMALLKPPGLLGIHTNMPATLPAEISKALQAGDPAPAGLSADEQHALRDPSSTSSTSTASAMRARWRTARRRSTASRTRRSGLPPGCSTMTPRSYELIARVFDGKPEGLTRDDILDNVTLYWLTNTASRRRGSTGRASCAFFAPRASTIPVASAPSRTRSIRRRRAGPRRPIPTSSTTTGSPKAATSPPGSSRDFSEEMRASFRSLR